MKRIFFALAILALVLPATKSAQAGVDVSVDFFYNNLGSEGNWVEVGDYGYCWQPSVAVSNRDWRPYTDGYWAYTDVGWTWISYEDFGWATYHYGRWSRVRGQGWVWVPGREWAPAWVSWRTGGDHIGWAPLPPRRDYTVDGEAVYEGRSINGDVDIDFDIGPDYYNFVDIRYIGEPVLRSRILASTQNVTYINSTVNVTNITYNNSTVYNYGPDYNRVSAYSARPIQRLTLQRQTDSDLNAVKSGEFTKVEGNTLMVAAPREFKRAEKNAAPKEVKTKIARTDLETGWSNISDEKQKSELQAKMKKEDRKSIPPTKLEPTNPAALTAPLPGAPASVAEQEKGKENGRGKGHGKPVPAVSVAPAMMPAPGSEVEPPKGDMKKDGEKVKGGKRFAPTPMGTVPPAAPTPMGTPMTPPAKEKGAKAEDRKIERQGREKNVAPVAPTNVEPLEAKKPADVVPPEGRGGKKKEAKLPDMQTSERPLMPEKKIEKQAAPTMDGDNGRGRGNHKAERMNTPQPPDNMPPREQAPREQPPREQPPREQPPREQPPREQPPREQAPREQAPREQPPVRKGREVAPPQMAPPHAPENAPAPGGERKEKAKGNKQEKKGDEQPPPEG